MPRWTRMALAAAGLAGAVLAAGCEGDYYGDRDGYYGDSGHYRHHDRYDRGDYDRDDYRGRHRVCDADGDDCRWERD